MQLLSLQGKAEVLVEKLHLTVNEDHGGTGISRCCFYLAQCYSELLLSTHYFTTVILSFSMSEIRSASSQSDVQQLLDSIPSHNLPPFLKTLVTSLQHLQAQVSHKIGQYQISTLLYHFSYKNFSGYVTYVIE